MVLIKARLYGGPLDGRVVRVDVKDGQNPPEFGGFGYSRQDATSLAPLHLYRRAARDPWNSQVWDYVVDTPEDPPIGPQRSGRDLFMTRRR
jgi:hypothetical protein